MFCERVIGTIRRECLDWMILLNEAHLRRVLREWVAHYNRGRPHASLGPGEHRRIEVDARDQVTLFGEGHGEPAGPGRELEDPDATRIGSSGADRAGRRRS